MAALLPGKPPEQNSQQDQRQHHRAYTDYASDKDGDYTFVLGAKVNSGKEIPSGMIAIQIPSGRYAMFTSEKGPVYKIMFELWQPHLGNPKIHAARPRLQNRFEIYDQRATGPENSQVDVYVGIN